MCAITKRAMCWNNGLSQCEELPDAMGLSRSNSFWLSANRLAIFKVNLKDVLVENNLAFCFLSKEVNGFIVWMRSVLNWTKVTNNLDHLVRWVEETIDAQRVVIVYYLNFTSIWSKPNIGLFFAYSIPF